MRVTLRTHPLLVQGDLLGEALLGTVPDGVVVSIGQEVGQLVLALGVLLHAHALEYNMVVEYPQWCFARSSDLLGNGSINNRRSMTEVFQ